jgi:hypothetical protein
MEYRRKLLLCCIVLLQQLAMAQSNTNRLSGKVTNVLGNGVAMATIVVKADTLNYGGSANKKGEYDVVYGKADSITVIFSCVGYESKTIRLRVNRKDMRQNVMLDEKNVELEGVEVEGQSYIRKLDRIIYLPSRKQVNAANSGVGLLANLMIPMLNVNKITKSISSVEGSKVSLCIDGRDVGQDEVEQLRPKDIQRVDFYDHPTGQFAGKKLVVNYIVKHYDYGGYVDLRGRTSFISQNGAYSSQLNLNHKKMTYTLLLGTGYLRDKGSYSLNKSMFNFIDNPFERDNYTKNALTKQLSDYAVFRTVYSGKVHSLSITCGLLWNETPDCYSDITQSFNPQVDTSTKALSKSYDKTLQPYMNFFWGITLPKMQFIWTSGAYIFADSRHNSDYTDYTDAGTAVSNVHEYNNSFSIGTKYLKYHTNGNYFMAAIYEVYRNSRDKYSGSTASRQSLISSETMFDMGYSFNLFHKVTISPMLSTVYNYYEINDEVSKSKSYLRPSLSMTYFVNKKSNLSLTWSYYNSGQSMVLLNGADVLINRYEMLRGNPNLGMMHYMEGRLTYSLYLKNWCPVLFVNYFSTRNMAKDYYYPENGIMVKQFVTDGNFHSFHYSFANTIYLLKKNLQLQVDLNIFQQMVNGKLYSLHDHSFAWSSKLSYFLGAFSVFAYYDSRLRHVDSTPTIISTSPDYGLSATYSHKNLYVEIGCRDIFNKDLYNRTMLSTPYYSYENRSYSKSSNQQFYVSLSYNFDFGRKISKSKLNVEESNRSSILRNE